MSDNFFSKLYFRLLVNYFLDILHQFIITNDYLHFSSYFRQSKILSDINGRRTLRGPTNVHDTGSIRAFNPKTGGMCIVTKCQ